MYKCNNCGDHFDAPISRKEYHHEVAQDGWVPFETFSCCPFCESDDFDAVDECAICGEPNFSERDICPDCQSKINRFMDRGIASMLFDDDETYERYAKNAILDYIVEVYAEG